MKPSFELLPTIATVGSVVLASTLDLGPIPPARASETAIDAARVLAAICSPEAPKGQTCERPAAFKGTGCTLTLDGGPISGRFVGAGSQILARYTARCDGIDQSGVAILEQVGGSPTLRNYLPGPSYVNCMAVPMGQKSDRILCLDQGQTRGSAWSAFVEQVLTQNPDGTYDLRNTTIGPSGQDETGHYGAPAVSCTETVHLLDFANLRPGPIPGTAAVDVRRIGAEAIAKACRKGAKRPAGSFGSPGKGWALVPTDGIATVPYAFDVATQSFQPIAPAATASAPAGGTAGDGTASFDAFFTGIEKGCQASDAQQAFETSLHARWGANRSASATLVRPAGLEAAFGEPKAVRRKDHVEITVPVRGTYKGLHLKKFVSVAGIHNGIGLFRLVFSDNPAAGAATVDAVIAKAKTGFNGEGFEVTRQTIDRELNLVCDLSN